MKFGIRGQLTDVITCVKFLVDRFRGYGVLTPQNCHFPLTCCVALTTVYALPCDTVIKMKTGQLHRIEWEWELIYLLRASQTGPLAYLGTTYQNRPPVVSDFWHNIIIHFLLIVGEKFRTVQEPVILEVWTYSKVPALMGNYGTDPGILWEWEVKQDTYFQHYNFNSTELTDISIQPTAPPQTLQQTN